MLPPVFLDPEVADLTERVGDSAAGRIGDLWAVKLDMVIVESL